MRSLITGGAGFIGSHLVEHLLARGDEVVVVDNLSTGRESNLSAVIGHERMRFVRSDLVRALDGALAGARFDQIYHLAAAVGVRKVLDDPIGSIETNVLDTIGLLRYAETHGPGASELPGVLIASSSEVYGKSGEAVFREGDDCVYGATSAWRWCYGCSKAIDEHLALAHHAKHGLPVVIARFFNIVGPRQIGDYGMVLPSMVGEVLAGRPPQVFGDGTQSRCFCDVRDVVPVLAEMMGEAGCVGEVFNLGSDEVVTMQELAHRVVEALGAKAEPVMVSYDRAYSPGFEDLMRRKPDISKIRSCVGFERRIDLATTIRDLAAEIGGCGSAASGVRVCGGEI
jgi:UDP-glucose 4-epimerase